MIASLDGVPAAKLRLADVRAALAAEGSSHRVEITRGKESVPLSFVVRLVSIED